MTVGSRWVLMNGGAHASGVIPGLNWRHEGTIQAKIPISNSFSPLLWSLIIVPYLAKHVRMSEDVEWANSATFITNTCPQWWHLEQACAPNSPTKQTVLTLLTVFRQFPKQLRNQLTSTVLNVCFLSLETTTKKRIQKKQNKVMTTFAFSLKKNKNVFTLLQQNFYVSSCFLCDLGLKLLFMPFLRSRPDSSPFSAHSRPVCNHAYNSYRGKPWQRPVCTASPSPPLDGSIIPGDRPTFVVFWNPGWGNMKRLASPPEVVRTSGCRSAVHYCLSGRRGEKFHIVPPVSV